MSAEENMELARRYLEARVKGDLDAMDEVLAPDFVSRTALLSVQEPDREGVKWVTAQFAAATSNASIHFEDQVAANDKVVSRFIVHATHDRGELMGVAPSGREIAFKPVDILRISGGKIAEEWGASMGLSELLRSQRRPRCQRDLRRRRRRRCRR
jgi:predicted ester cyclase